MTVLDPLQQVLDDTRQRFVAAFTEEGDALRILVDRVADLGSDGPVADLARVTHRLSGLAGTIGFPTISARAADLEILVDGVGRSAFDVPAARAAVDAIRAAFVTDLAAPPSWALPAAVPSNGARILIAEDEADQLAIVTACLKGAGYLPIAVVSGDLVLQAARTEQPALILLDIALPRLDGFSVCRLLKADPELAAIPVFFLTTGANLDDRLAGLTLGADEFLPKPVDMRELVLRIQIVLDRCRARRAADADDPCVSKELTYDAFLAIAKDEIARSPVALVIVRLPAEQHREGARLLTEEIRGRDSVGAYGPTRALILMPQMTAAAARERIAPVLDRMAAHGLPGVCAGVTSSPGADAKAAHTLIGEAEEALAAARYLGDSIAIWTDGPGRPGALPAVRSVVIAEDDPDVTRILDAQMRAAGFAVSIAFDGEQALAAVRAHSPDLLVLDVMMPKLNGFDVLTRLGESPGRRPRIIVLTARGREQDVMRAFELGADDYMTKPFNPQELLARVARLLK